MEGQLHKYLFDPLDWIIAERYHWKPVLIEETEVLLEKKLIDGCDANSK